MDEQIRRSSKISSYGKVAKAHAPKLIFTANFTKQHRHFDIMPERESMRQDILNSVLKRTESIMLENRESDCVNALYEDPRDVIVPKPPKPPRKRNVQGLAMTSPRPTKERRSSLKEQKKKLTRKYESLITELMDKCEEHALLLSEKESQVTKLKEKLKAVLGYNRLFAEENDRLGGERATLVDYVQECKRALREQQEISAEAERRCKSLEEKVKQYETPDKEDAQTTVPLVEVCMSCGSRQILLQRARDQNQRLQRDMQGLKELLYRLNVQLSRYQEKVRSSAGPLAAPPLDRPEGLDSLIAASLTHRPDAVRAEDAATNRASDGDETHSARVADLSSLLSAQALAPLFDAYQENLQEKDNLILDYEKQFENMNKKSKQIVAENKSLSDRVDALETELADVRQRYKKLAVEKETVDIEEVTLVERAEKAETKLKEVYELYEDKMAAMARDYETVHREYYAARRALGARPVPAELHARRLADCERLLEELKHQYGMEGERRQQRLQRLQQELAGERRRAGELGSERDRLRAELAAAQKAAKLYRKAAVVFRQRARAAAARANRAARRRAHGREPLRRALDALDNIKQEIKEVKARAQSSLAELERRLEARERRAAHAQEQWRRERERTALALQHKEDIIRSLIDKVADVEEVRLSQTNTHRLQGIVSDSSPEPSPAHTPQEKREPKAAVRLVPGPGGYFQEKDSKRKSNS